MDKVLPFKNLDLDALCSNKENASLFIKLMIRLQRPCMSKKDDSLHGIDGLPYIFNDPKQWKY